MVIHLLVIRSNLVLADDGNIGVYQKVTGEYIIDDPGKLPGDQQIQFI